MDNCICDYVFLLLQGMAGKKDSLQNVERICDNILVDCVDIFPESFTYGYCLYKLVHDDVVRSHRMEKSLRFRGNLLRYSDFDYVQIVTQLQNIKRYMNYEYTMFFLLISLFPASGVQLW